MVTLHIVCYMVWCGGGDGGGANGVVCMFDGGDFA